MRLRPFAVFMLLPALWLALLLFVGCASVQPIGPPAESGEAAPAPGSDVIVLTPEAVLTAPLAALPGTDIIITQPGAILIGPHVTHPSAAAPGPQPDWVALRADACKSYMDVNLHQAFERFPHPVFWTFHTSFLDLDPADDPDIRLGCLRFYWRDTSTQTFTGTLQSAVVVQCTKHGNGLLQTETVTKSIPSSSFLRPDDDPSLPQRVTRINDGAYLECPLDIHGMLYKVGQTAAFSVEVSQLPLSNDRQEVEAAVTASATLSDTRQNYEEFMTAVALSTTGQSPLHTDSLIFYQPQTGPSMLESEQPTYEVELSLVQSPTLAMPELAAATLGGASFDSAMSSDGPQCWLPARPFYLWVSFGNCARGDPQDCPSTPLDPNTDYLEFLSRDAPPSPPPGSPLNPPPLNLCHVEPSLVQAALKGVPFYAGPATVYIGHNPRSGELIQDELILFEAWLDPDSSIRPTP